MRNSDKINSAFMVAKRLTSLSIERWGLYLVIFLLSINSSFGHTFTIELANGCLNYLPTPEELDFGGYETWLSINRVEKQTSVKLTRDYWSFWKV